MGEVDGKLQKAYEEPTYERKKFLKMQKELWLINCSTVNSLDEGSKETLTVFWISAAISWSEIDRAPPGHNSSRRGKPTVLVGDS